MGRWPPELFVAEEEPFRPGSPNEMPLEFSDPPEDRSHLVMSAWDELRGRIVLAVLLIFLGVCTVVGLTFTASIDQVRDDMGQVLARKQAATVRARLREALAPELALARQLAGSPVIRRWALRENEPASRHAALQELESYRQRFTDHSWFYVIHDSRHYYYNDRDNRYAGRELIGTLDPAHPKDSWYFSTHEKVQDYALNADYNPQLDVFNLWINVQVRDESGRSIGLAGTGLDMRRFLRLFIDRPDDSTETLLINRQLAIQAHPNRALIDQHPIAASHPQPGTMARLMPTGEVETLMRLLAQMEQEGHDAEPRTVKVHLSGQTRTLGIAPMPEIGLFAISALDLAPVISWQLFEPFLLLSISALMLIGVAIYWTIGRLVVRRLAELALTTRKLDQALRDQALRDSLTGLFNRRYFDLAIRREIAASERSGRPFSVALIDFDHFKNINDTHGHQAGDAALRRLADMLRVMVRSSDSVCRWGGDEFAVLMPDTSLEAAAGCADRWRQALGQAEMRTGAQQWHFTVSTGLAAYPSTASSSEELLRQMDLALYSAKSTGRNRIGKSEPA